MHPAPAGQPQIVWGTQPYPQVPQGSSSPPGGNLWGSNVRRTMGIIQIVCGGIAFVLGIAIICIPFRYYYDPKDYAGWGLWDGVFAIVTGFLGFYSRKKKGMVVAYMVTSIIAAVMGACCCIYAAVGTTYASYSSYNGPANFAVYIIMCIVFFIQMVISIVGASFTCNAVCSTSNQPQQMVYYYAPQPQQPQFVPAPPYTWGPAQQFSAPQNPQALPGTAQVSVGSNDPSKM